MAPSPAHPPSATLPLFLGPGHYRLGAWVTFAVFVLVFGGLWALVAIDHLRTQPSEDLRFVVLSLVCPLVPLVALGWALAVNRRGRRKVDFDTVVALGPASLVLAHSFDGRRSEVPLASVAAWTLVGRRTGDSGRRPAYHLEVRLVDGRVLRSETQAWPDRLRRGLKALALPFVEDDTARG